MAAIYEPAESLHRKSIVQLSASSSSPPFVPSKTASDLLKGKKRPKSLFTHKTFVFSQKQGRRGMDGLSTCSEMANVWRGGIDGA